MLIQLGSKNRPKDNPPKPRKPYTSTKRAKCVVKEDLLERLKREVTEQALAVVPCEQFERWLASYAAHEGNDYVRKDDHEHTYNSTHHRVVTYVCNHTIPRTKPKASEVDILDHGTELDDADGAEVVNRLLREGEPREPELEFELVECDAILDIYYFYESKHYQIIQLGEHAHQPTNVPQNLFGTMPGLPSLPNTA